MIYRCKYCVKKFSQEELDESGTVPGHIVVRGTDTYSCKGGGKRPRQETYVQTNDHTWGCDSACVNYYLYSGHSLSRAQQTQAHNDKQRVRQLPSRLGEH